MNKVIMKSHTLLKVLGLLFSIAPGFSNAQMNLTFTASNYNGYNVSCFGMSDGSLTVNVTGGTAPYSYLWSNGATTQSISELTADHYSVTVTDANSGVAEEGINLTSPHELMVTLSSPVYPNQMNVSCFECSNANITSSVSYAVSVYTHSWLDGPTTANRSGLGKGVYKLTVTDANGCISSEEITITEPDRDDWPLSGTTGTNPPNQFIGTVDNKDLVFKTNGAERFKIKANGELNVNNLAGSDSRTVIVDELGNIKRADFFIGHRPADQDFTEIMSFGGPPNTGTLSIQCSIPIPDVPLNYQFNGSIQLWGLTNGTTIMNVMNVGFDGANSTIESTTESLVPSANRLLLNYYCGRDVFVGRSDGGVLRANYNFEVGGTSEFTGNVGIGVEPASGGVYKLKVCGSIGAKEIVVEDNGTFCDFVFEEGYKRMTMEARENFLKTKKHLPYISPGKEISKDGLPLKKTLTGLTQNVEEMSLDMIEMYKMIKELKLENAALKKGIAGIKKK